MLDRHTKPLPALAAVCVVGSVNVCQVERDHCEPLEHPLSQPELPRGCVNEASSSIASPQPHVLTAPGALLSTVYPPPPCAGSCQLLGWPLGPRHCQCQYWEAHVMVFCSVTARGLSHQSSGLQALCQVSHGWCFPIRVLVSLPWSHSHMPWRDTCSRLTTQLGLPVGILLHLSVPELCYIIQKPLVAFTFKLLKWNKTRSSVPLSHQPHLMCSVAVCG